MDNSEPGKLKKQYDKVKSYIEIADVAFVCIRIIIFCGALGWLFFSDIPKETFENVRNIFYYFVAYSILIYTWLFISPSKKKVIYGFSLIFDLLYASLLVFFTGGFHSSFFNAFYLIAALYSFYYGLVSGTAIAAVASVLYFISCGYNIYEINWTDYAVKVAFLFLLAIPLGMLSQKLKNDKRKIENLNTDLEGYIDELRSVQGKLIQVEKLSALGRLTADVAHEIRNPLTSIGGFARRLNSKLVEGSSEKGYAEIVVNEVDRLERILRDVLTFSKETKSHMAVQDINETILEAVKAITGVSSEKSVRIVSELRDSLHEVFIDKDQVRQAVNNLISNAIDVTNDGGSVLVKTYEEYFHEVHYVVVEVSDSGPGLSAEAMNMIFEPFYTTKEIGAGTGLGLSICKKIIDEHNGLIFIDSELSEGTSFKLFFPYQSIGDKTLNCWEYTKCGVENAVGAANFRCPAYPDYGRICWAIAGTFCGKKVSGAIAQKIGNCKKCDFYQKVAVRKEL